MLYSIIGWYGGKSWLVDQINQLIPPHETSIEGFAGGAWFTLNKPPSRFEVVNDINGLLINLWEVLRKNRRELRERCEYALDSQELYYRYRDEYYEDKWEKCDEVEKAFRFFYMNAHSFSSTLLGYHGIAFTRENQHNKSFRNKFEIFDAIHDRIKDVMFKNESIFELLSNVDQEGVFIYLDPPYFDGGGAYEKIVGGAMWSQHDFHKLRDLVWSFKKAKVMISIDNGEFFLGTGWRLIEVEKKKKTREENMPNRETLVLNYEPVKWNITTTQSPFDEF